MPDNSSSSPSNTNIGTASNSVDDMPWSIRSTMTETGAVVANTT